MVRSVWRPSLQRGLENLQLRNVSREMSVAAPTIQTQRLLRFVDAAAVVAAFLVASAAVQAAEAARDDAPARPGAAVQPLPLDAVAWTDGFWAQRIGVCRDTSVPAMGRLMASGEYKPFLGHFYIAAGLAEGDYHGAQWNDGDYYKWLEAAIATVAATGDEDLQAQIDESIRVIAAAQRSDGYIHTPVLIRQRHGDLAAAPFQDRFAFEMYNMGHLMTTACLHHQLTGRTDLLTVAEQAADFLQDAFRNPSPQLARNSVCPAHYMGLVELYRTTGKPQYLQFAQRLIAMRDLIADGGDDNQDRMPLRQQDEVVGHAVRANYLYCGVADLFAETQDAELFAPLAPLWKNWATKKMYVTGGCGALYDGASPDGSPRQDQITRVHQAYGRNYQLPQITAHNETCANIAGAMWSWRMFLLTGEAKYVDAVELALYNSVLSGVSLAGTDYFYTNPLRVVDPLPTELRFPRTRQPFFTSFCCPPNLLRTLARLGEYAYARTDDAVWVNLYGGSRLETKLLGQPLKLAQETEYPWDGTVRITVDACPAKEFAVRLRIPAWVAGATVAINGERTAHPPDAGSYCELRRKWRPGDQIELTLPMETQLLQAHPLVEEATNQVAVRRGPVVYCLESTDLPDGVAIDSVAIPRNATLAVKREPELLGGVATVTASAVVRQTPPWDDALYRPLSEAVAQEIDVRLIPYYAWGNRGKSEMTVWLPLD